MRRTIKTLDDFIEVMSDTIRAIKEERDRLVGEIETKKEPCKEIKEDLKEFKYEFIKLYDYPDMFIELGDGVKAKKLIDELKELELRLSKMEEKLS